MAVAERLRADILSSRYSPGSKLRFESLKKDYGVGFSPLREALSQLVAKRLVTTDGQRGFRVAEASIADITDIAMVRSEIEGHALAKSIEYGGDAWEGDVVATRHRLALLEHRNSNESVNEEEWEQRHREFHNALISGCRSTWLIYMTEQINDQFDRYRRMAVKNSLSLSPTSLEHQKIMEAAIGRKSGQAVKLLCAHIDEALGLIVDGNTDFIDR